MTPPLNEDRRSNDPILMTLIQQIHDSQMALDKKLSEHMISEPVEIGEKIAGLMQAAFPEGDPEGHRRHHELVIAQAEEKAEFWKAMRKEIGKWGLIGVLSFIVVAIWHSFLQGPPK